MRGGRVRRWLVVATVMALSAVVVVPARASGPQPATATLETFALPSPLIDPATPGGKLEAGRTSPRVHVLLPPGYAEHPDRRYPVLWLLHGANGGTDTWIPGITKLAPGFPGIIVMPDGGLFGMYTDWWNGGVRGGPAWATFHLQVLRQAIEERYRIRPERRWHAIGGISMGGQGALRYAAMLPGYFGSVATFSAALPDMQAVEAQGGIGLIALAGQSYGATYEQIYGPATGEFAEGYNPRALVPNLEHTRIYLTSGWGIACPQDPVNPAGVGPRHHHRDGPPPPAGAVRGRRPGGRGPGDRRDHVRDPHLRRVGPRHPRSVGVGDVRPRPRGTRALDVPDHRDVGCDVGPPVPLRRAAGGRRRLRALRAHPEGDRRGHRRDRRPSRLPRAADPALRATAPAGLPTLSLMGDDWVTVLAEVRTTCSAIVNELFRERLLGYPLVRELVEALNGS